MKSSASVSGIVFAILFSLFASVAGYCADPQFSWQTATASASKAAKSPSESYYHRAATYLRSIKLTPEQTASIEKLQKAAAADIDAKATHKAATAAFHASVLSLLTKEQLATVQAAHKRPAKAKVAAE